MSRTGETDGRNGWAGIGETDGDKGERRFSGKLITRVDKITDIREKVMPKFANTEKFL